MGLFQMLMPKEGRFFDLFNQHARTMVSGAKALSDLLEGGEAVAPAAARVEVIEEEADAIAAEVMTAVHRTFITPFDRSDIKDLIGSLDDAVDQMRQTARAITLYEVTSFEPGMREMATIIVSAAELAAEMVTLLPNMSKNLARLNTLAKEIGEAEETSDTLYDQGRKALFLAHKVKGGDPMAFIVGVEIYGHLEKVADRFEDVANRISGIVIEQV